MGWITWRAGLLGCLASGLSAGLAAGQGGPDPTGRLGWLAGCWQLERGERTTVEMWMAPAGGLMVGGSRTVVAGHAREYEHLRIAARGEGIVYVARPSGQATAEFTGSVSDSGFAVENPTHDFPRRIVYARRGADSLLASIEGPGRDGQPRVIVFPFRRTACGQP